MDVLNSSKLAFLCPLENLKDSKLILSTSEEGLEYLNIKYLLPFAGFALMVFIKGFKIYQSHASKNEREDSEIFTVVCFVAAVFTAPIIICSVPAIACYRLIVFIYLKRKWRHLFKGLFKGPDVMWAIETPESRSIINVLILLEMPFSKIKYHQEPLRAGKQLLYTVRNLTDYSLLQSTSPFPKLKWLRQKSRLGYYYWKHYKESTIEQFVRPLETFKHCPDGLTKRELEVIVGKYSNSPLPFDDHGTWEILVGQQNLLNTEMTKSYPILVRIHHSVGDGVALLRLFLEGLADIKKIPASLPKTMWSDKGRTHSSTETESDIDESEDVQLPQPSSSHLLSPVTIESLQSHILTDSVTNDTKKNNLKVKLGKKLKNIFTKLTSPTKNIFLSPSKVKFSCVKDRPEPIVPKQLDHEASKLGTFLVNPRSVSQSPAAEPNIKDETNPLIFTQISSSFRNVHQYNREKNDLASSVIHDNYFEKCIPVKFSSTSVTALKSVFLPKEEINLKTCLLYFVIAIIISVVCIQRTLSLYFQILYPKVRKCSKFCFMTPRVMFCQLFKTHKNDVLYGRELSGNKVLSWVTDNSDLTKSFRTKIREIRDHYGITTKFSHVLYTCLSKSLHKYYLERNAPVPPYINVVLPARAYIDDMSEGCGIKLENKFTVAMMKLPIGSVPLGQDMRLLEAIQLECHRLKNAPDYLANYWLLRWFAHLVPNQLLEPFMKTPPCTLVFSNLPGPEDVVHLAHIPISDIIFWVPNRGVNGVGIGMLSYCGRFSAGIIVDKALIPNDDDAHQIVEGIYEEVNFFLSNKVISNGNEMNKLPSELS